MMYMKNPDLKSILIIEAVIVLLTGLFAMDFLPRNYNEYNRICLESWSKEPRQFETCMAPYHMQTSLDKYAIGVGIGLLVLTPFIYSSVAKKLELR